MPSLTFLSSSTADSQFVERISEASLPQVEAETLSLSVERTRNWYSISAAGPY